MPARRFAQVFGAVYVLVGLLGFVFTGFSDVAAPSDDKLLLFGVNPLHNLVHIGIGALWLASSRSESSARAISTLIGGVYLVVGVLGLFINGTSDLNILNINQPDNALHLASAVLGLYFGLAGRPGPRPAPASTGRSARPTSAMGRPAGVGRWRRSAPTGSSSSSRPR